MSYEACANLLGSMQQLHCFHPSGPVAVASQQLGSFELLPQISAATIGAPFCACRGQTFIVVNATLGGAFCSGSGRRGGRAPLLTTARHRTCATKAQEGAESLSHVLSGMLPPPLGYDLLPGMMHVYVERAPTWLGMSAPRVAHTFIVSLKEAPSPDLGVNNLAWAHSCPTPVRRPRVSLYRLAPDAPILVELRTLKCSFGALTRTALADLSLGFLCSCPTSTFRGQRLRPHRRQATRIQYDGQDQYCWTACMVMDSSAWACISVLCRAMVFNALQRVHAPASLHEAAGPIGRGRRPATTRATMHRWGPKPAHLWRHKHRPAPDRLSRWHGAPSSPPSQLAQTTPRREIALRIRRQVHRREDEPLVQWLQHAGKRAPHRRLATQSGAVLAGVTHPGEEPPSDCAPSQPPTAHALWHGTVSKMSRRNAPCAPGHVPGSTKFAGLHEELLGGPPHLSVSLGTHQACRSDHTTAQNARPPSKSRRCGGGVWVGRRAGGSVSGSWRVPSELR